MKNNTRVHEFEENIWYAPQQHSAHVVLLATYFHSPVIILSSQPNSMEM
jgi:hypothetical protein